MSSTGEASVDVGSMSIDGQSLSPSRASVDTVSCGGCPSAIRAPTTNEEGACSRSLFSYQRTFGGGVIQMPVTVVPPCPLNKLREPGEEGRSHVLSYRTCLGVKGSLHLQLCLAHRCSRHSPTPQRSAGVGVLPVFQQSTSAR